MYNQVHGQVYKNGKWVTWWEVVNTNVPVPIGKRYPATIDFMKGDSINFTFHTDDPKPDGLSHFIPLYILQLHYLIRYRLPVDLTNPLG